MNKKYPWTLEEVNSYLQGVKRPVDTSGHYMTKVLLAVLLFPVRLLSWKAAERLGASVGWLMAVLRIRRDVALINMDIVYGDKKTLAEKKAIYKASMINMGRHVINYLRVPQMDEEFWENFKIKNEHILEDTYNRGKGVIFVGGHIGEWEIGSARAGMAGYPISMVAKILKNPVMENFMNEGRLGMNQGTIGHKKSMGRIMTGMKENGEGICMAVDQNMKRSQGIFVDFMGRTASTPRSIAWMAKETGAPVVYGYAYRTGVAKYVIDILGEIPWESHDDPEEELRLNTQNYAKAMGDVILEKPELWLWIHRRWKVQPEGTPNPYEK